MSYMNYSLKEDEPAENPASEKSGYQKQSINSRLRNKNRAFTIVLDKKRQDT